MRKLVLFDVDGTLLATAGVGRRAIHAALLDEIGVDGPFNGVAFDGKTDPQIVRELFAAAGRAEPVTDAEVDTVCTRYLDLLEHELTGERPRPTVLPGVCSLLDKLEASSDVVLGLLTGNLTQGAQLKLTAAGIAFERFRVGAFGSDHAERARLPAIAAERAAPLMGRRPEGAEVVIVGDTPADMTCGSALRARALGVATGRYSTAELQAAGAYATFPDLSDGAPVLSAIRA